MLARMMLAGVHVSPAWVSELARAVSAAGAVELAHRLDRAIINETAGLLALTIDERAITLGQLSGPPRGLAELRAVFLNEHEWCQRAGLDP